MFDIGSSLREARLRQDLDFPELEERTKIRPKYLRALEDEQFEILPAPTYVRGFLRSYAEASGSTGSRSSTSTTRASPSARTTHRFARAAFPSSAAIAGHASRASQPSRSSPSPS